VWSFNLTEVTKKNLQLLLSHSIYVKNFSCNIRPKKMFFCKFVIFSWTFCTWWLKGLLKKAAFATRTKKLFCQEIKKNGLVNLFVKISDFKYLSTSSASNHLQDVLSYLKKKSRAWVLPLFLEFCQLFLLLYNKEFRSANKTLFQLITTHTVDSLLIFLSGKRL